MRYGIIAAIAPIVLAAGCAQQRGAVYAVPIEEAHRILARTSPPVFVFGSARPAVEVRAETVSTIVWIVRKDGAEVLRYVADLSRVEDGSTRVELTLQGAAQGPFGNVEQRLADNASVRNLYLTAMDERIASALERRPMNMGRITRATAGATIANLGELNARMDRAAAEFRRRDRANIEKAYRDEAAGVRY